MPELSRTGESVQIRYVEDAATCIGGVPTSTISVAVPHRGRRIVRFVYSAPALTFLAARVAALAGLNTLGWKIVAYASLLTEAGLLAFRRSLARTIERATVRWSVWAGRHPDLLLVEGKITARLTTQSELSRRSAVLVRTRRKDLSRSLISDGLRGVDFTVLGDDGVRYAVAPSPHLYFDEPPPALNDETEATETLLCPGDRVRVWATAIHEPAPSGDRPDLRSPPLQVTLVGSESSPLVIRFAKR